MKQAIAAAAAIYLTCSIGFVQASPSSQAEFAPVTREELSHAYMRFDSLLHQNPQSAERMIELNKGFDAVTQKFFTFQLAAATHDLNELSLSLLPAVADKDAYRVAWSLATELSPVDLRTDSPDAAIVLRSMYPVPAAAPVSLWVELAPSDAPLPQVTPVLHKIVAPVGSPVQLRLPLKDVFAARENLSITFSFSADELFETRRYLVPRADPEFFSGPFAHKLATFRDTDEKDAGYQRAKVICAERIKNFSGTHSAILSAQYLLNPKIYERQLYQEIKLLSGGINPYRNRPGDIWRPVISEKAKYPPVPCRVYMPGTLESVTGGSSRGSPLGAPLIIALHGAGGDESMFMDAYGCGEIKRLADEFNFIVASPAANTLTLHSAALTDLIDQLSEDFSIDKTRIYVIGHSMGAGLASRIAFQRADIAAAVCIAGGDFAAAARSSSCPTLVYGAQLDPLISAEVLAKKVAAAKAAGHTIEYRLAENQGHTLIVSAKLRESVEWLLTHKLVTK